MPNPNRSNLGRVAALAVLGWSVSQAKSHTVSPREERTFRAVNDASDRIEWPVWAVMQSGSLGAVLGVAGAAAYRPEISRTPPSLLALCGTSVWGGVKVAKPLVGRGRPQHHLEAVNVRGAMQAGLGFPSGHAAVSTTLAILTTSAGAPRRLGIALAGATGVARMYAGAHLPLDVVGGFAIARLATDVIEVANHRWGRG